MDHLHSACDALHPEDVIFLTAKTPAGSTGIMIACVPSTTSMSSNNSMDDEELAVLGQFAKLMKHGLDSVSWKNIAVTRQRTPSPFLSDRQSETKTCAAPWVQK